MPHTRRMTPSEPQEQAGRPSTGGQARQLRNLLGRLRWGSFKGWALADAGPLTQVMFRPLLPVFYLFWAAVWLVVIALYIVFLPTIVVFSSIGRRR